MTTNKSPINEAQTQSAAPPPWLRAALWCLALTIYFWNLGGGSLADWDEALTGERAREFLLGAGAHWLTPYFQGAPDFNKPPLYYWFTALLIKIFGAGEFPVRFGSALAGIGCLALVGRIARRVSDWRGAAFAMLFLATNAHWIDKTRQGLLDSAMLLAMLAALDCLIHRPPTRAGLLGGSALIAAGCLVKCPMALFALAGPAFEFGIARRSPGWVRRLAIVTALSLFFALPWFIYEAWRWGDPFIQRFFFFNMYERLAVGIARRKLPPTILISTWAGAAPVFIAFFVASLALVYDRRARALRPWAVYLAMALLMLALIHATASWRIVYTLYVYPFAAIPAGAAAALALDRLRDVRWRRAAAALIAAACLAAFLPQYDAHMDFSKAAKTVALRLREHSRPEDLVLTVDLPVNVILYYSQRTVGYVASADLARRIEGAGPRRRIYLVASGRIAKTLEKQAAALCGATRRARRLTDKNDYVVVVLENKTIDRRPELPSASGLQPTAF